MDCKVTGAFLCLWLFAAGASAEPFAVRDQNPLALIQGLPMPASARLPAAGAFDWSMTLALSNSLNVESNANESLLLDYEAHELLTRLSYGLGDDWALTLDIPLISYGGGFLDNTIEGWHQAFGLPNGSRASYPDNAYQLYYQSGTRAVVNTSTASNSLADIQLGIGKQLTRTATQASSVWLSLDLPTGDQAAFTGNGSSDIILQFANQHQLAADWLLDAGAAVTLPGASNLNGVAVADRIWSAQSGIEWRALPSFALQLQFNAHTRIYPDSALTALGNSYQLVFGGHLRLDECSKLAISVSEDIKPGSTADVSFGVSYRRRASCRA